MTNNIEQKETHSNTNNNERKWFNELPLQEFMKTLSKYHEFDSLEDLIRRAKVFLGIGEGEGADLPDTPEESYRLGMILIELENPDEGAVWIKSAAEAGLPEAQKTYADYLLNEFADRGREIEYPLDPKTFDEDSVFEKRMKIARERKKKVEDAMDWYWAAIEQGDVGAMVAAFTAYQGRIVSFVNDRMNALEEFKIQHTDIDEDGMARGILQRLREVADRGDARAIFEYARLTEDYDILEDAAENGNTYAMAYMSHLCYKQEIPCKDFLADAVKWALKGCEAGDAGCMARIANAYLLGQGLEYNPEKAFELATKAAGLGDSDACLALGKMYYSGIGVERSYGEARKWFRTVPYMGTAQYYLGEMFYRGLGVERNDGIAFEWYCLARECRKVEAEVKLKIMLANGHAVIKGHDRSEMRPYFPSGIFHTELENEFLNCFL